MPDNAHLTARALLPVVRVLNAANIEPGLVLREAGLSANDELGFDQRVSAKQTKAGWDAAAELSEDRSFGVRAASMLEPGDFDVLDFAMASAAVFGDAVAILERYQRLVHSAAAMTLSTRGEFTDSDLRSIRDNPVSDHFVEYLLGSWAMVTRRLLGPLVHWHEVRFVHDAPLDLSMHQSVFAAPLRFGCPYDGVTGLTKTLSSPVKSAAPKLLAVLERHADELLERLPAGDSFVHQVRSRIASQIGRSQLDSKAVAQHFGMSERSFRRRLQSSGVQYTELLDQARQHLAMQFLRNDSDDRSSEDIAFLLGYTEIGGLQRAVRRWTGKTLAVWRNECRQLSCTSRA